MSAVTRITYKEFTCPAGHLFKCLVAIRYSDGKAQEWYQPLGLPNQLPVPKCPAQDCKLIGAASAELARQYAAVPKSERFYAWLSPDGQRLSVPTPTDGSHAQMPNRYKKAGYVEVEAVSVQDLDRLDQIRAKQTGNEVWNEMNYSPAERLYHEQAEYTDDPTSVI